MANISKIQLPDGVTYNLKDDVSGYITGMTILSYGSSTYADALAAYQANKVVYCRASSSSNPGSGSQNRLAFLAYVNNSTTPTEFEFQYYRSVSSHTSTQQGDQVYVYKLNSSGTWSVTTREAYTKITTGTGVTNSYTTGTSASIALSLADTYGDTKNPYGTKTANYVLAGPTSGNAAAPTFRALVAGDIPDLSGTYLTDVQVDGTSVVTSGVAEINSEIYYVKFTDTGDGYVSDKTYAEIDQAARDGKQIIGYLYNEWPEDDYSTYKFYFLDNSWYEGDAGRITFLNVRSGVEEYVDIYLDENDDTIVEVGLNYATNLNGSNTSYAQFYAPISAGTSGYILKSNGANQNPTWISADLTDTKVSTAAVTSGTTYYPVVGSDTTSAATKYYDNKGLSYVSTQGSSNTSGSSILTLGQAANYGTANGRYGRIDLYSQTGKKGSIYQAGNYTADRTYTLPNKTGTIALTSDIPTVPTNVSAFTNDAGYLTSYTETDPTVPSWAKADSKPTYTASEVGAVATTAVGSANGVAPLDANGLVTSSYLPSYVDDVLEYATRAGFPAMGETGKIYVDTDTNKTYRWGGSEYVEISASLAIGTTSSTAAAGNHTHTVSITPSTTNVYSMTSAGSVTAGSAASFTAGTFTAGSLTMAINGTDSNQLDITFVAPSHSADTFTANTPTAVTLPGRSSAIAAWTGYSSASAQAQT